MAGSIQAYLYTTNTAQQFVIRMDEDWATAMSNPPVGAVSLYGIPKNLKPRYARYVFASGKVKRTIVVCNPAATSETLPKTLQLTASNAEVSPNAADNALVFKEIVGERFKLWVSTPDTGLDDGD